MSLGPYMYTSYVRQRVVFDIESLLKFFQSSVASCKPRCFSFNRDFPSLIPSVLVLLPKFPLSFMHQIHNIAFLHETLNLKMYEVWYAAFCIMNMVKWMSSENSVSKFMCKKLCLSKCNPISMQRMYVFRVLIHQKSMFCPHDAGLLYNLHMHFSSLPITANSAIWEFWKFLTFTSRRFFCWYTAIKYDKNHPDVRSMLVRWRDVWNHRKMGP